MKYYRMIKFCFKCLYAKGNLKCSFAVYFKFSIMIMCKSYETETIKNNSYLSKDCIWQRISPLNIKYIGTISKESCSSLDLKLKRTKSKNPSI